MLKLLRHLLAVAALPFAVTVLVPWWLARRYGIVPSLGASGGALFLQGVGLVALAVGLVLFVATLRLFAVRGRGTLAPWDPPRRLVVTGPYRYVRNPMISGVFFVLAAEAMLLQSNPHAVWTLVFLAINLVYIPLVEERGLRARFGEEYRRYCRHVPRIFPRLRPWDGGTIARVRSGPKGGAMADFLLYAASAIAGLWGIAHLVATRGVVAGFGALTVDNRRIIAMEWIVEGVALVSIATLVAAVTAVDRTAATSSAAYAVTIATLVALALVSVFTGFRIAFLPFRLCPFIFGASAALIAVGAWS